MRIEVELLGIINENGKPGSALHRKYVLKVTAEQLATWLLFDRKGKAKSAPFRILEFSTIKIDQDIQRGRDAEGYLLQNPAKVMDIANTLLHPAAEQVPRLYLGALTWNVRPKSNSDASEGFSIQKIEEIGKIPKYRLAFDTDAIYLTDSAHRHLGIVEAYRQYTENRSAYPSFDPRAEFSVELYTLSRTGEKELFSELNSKQKKISPSKKKEMDVSSPIGSLKDRIIEYDRTAQLFFDENIEVSSSQNDKHTLMTMSVFFHTVTEMFSGAEIKAARSDDDLGREIASYYCEYFYELARTLVVRADLDGVQTDVHPFRNLYLEVIKPAIDGIDPEKPQASDARLQKAFDDAKQMNRQLRAVDLANSNSFIRAFARLGGYIRRMEHWQNVLTRLQMQVNLPMECRMFQETNDELFRTDPALGTYIASKNEDGTLNVQVQTKTINACFEYLMRKANVRRDVSVVYGTAISTTGTLLQEETPPVQHIPLGDSTYGYFTLEFHLPNTVAEWEDNTALLEIDGGADWPSITRKAKTRLRSCACACDATYVDEFYSDICLWRASFEVQWPAGGSMKQTSANAKLKFSYPSFDDPQKLATITRTLTFVKSGLQTDDLT